MSTTAAISPVWICGHRARLAASKDRRRRVGVRTDLIGYIDLGDVVVIAPGGSKALRRALLDQLSNSDWQGAREGSADPGLASE